MTQSTRQKTLTATLFVTIALLAATATMIVFLILRGIPAEGWAHLRLNGWWFHYPEGRRPRSDHLIHLSTLILTQAGAAVLINRLRRVFGRSAAPEAYFLVFYLFSLAIEGLRVAIPHLETAGINVPLVLLAAKTVYAGRLFGSLCLFVTSLYFLPVQYPRLGTTIIMTALLTVLYGYTLVVDTSTQLVSFLYRLGDEKGTAIMIWVLSLMTVINPTIAAARQQDRRYIALSGSFAAMIAGRELMLFGPSPTAAIIGTTVILIACSFTIAQVRRLSDTL